MSLYVKIQGIYPQGKVPYRIGDPGNPWSLRLRKKHDAEMYRRDSDSGQRTDCFK